MSNLYLIAHKVRGEPAFDVARRMPCPLCQSYETVTNDWVEAHHAQVECVECDRLGYWWIISTSGHRAYTWRWWPLSELTCEDEEAIHPLDEILNGIPSEVPDHYACNDRSRKSELSSLLALLPKPPQVPMKRRF